MRYLFSKYVIYQYMNRNTRIPTWEYEADSLEEALKIAYIIVKEVTNYNFVEIRKLTDAQKYTYNTITIINR